MKTKILILSFWLALASAFAQTRSSGIYLSVDDYKKQQLSFAPAGGERFMIRLNEVIYSKYITVKSGVKKKHFLKDSIFGYREKEQDYRLYEEDGDSYQIMENGNVVIYKKDVKMYSSTGKTFQLVPAFFFSVTLQSEILPLTVENLKRAFPEDLKFHDLLDAAFYSQENLSDYNEKIKMYNVNNLFNKSIKN